MKNAKGFSSCPYENNDFVLVTGKSMIRAAIKNEWIWNVKVGSTEIAINMQRFLIR